MDRKLRFLKCKYFTGFRKYCYVRSEPMEVLREQERQSKSCASLQAAAAAVTNRQMKKKKTNAVSRMKFNAASVFDGVREERRLVPQSTLQNYMLTE